MKVIEKSSRREYLEFFLDIFQIMNFPYDQRIRGRKREFIIHSMSMFNEGWDLYTPEAVTEISERMKFSNEGEVYNYRKVLKEKKFFFQNKNGVHLIPPLCLKKIYPKLNYKFTVQINGQTHR